MSNGGVTLHIACARLKVFAPSRHVTAPFLFAKEVALPHREGLVRVALANDHLALLTVGRGAEAVIGA